MIHATLCFIFRDEPQPAILLGYKKRGFGMGKYGGFGGKLQDGETLRQAAQRELLEESGLSVVPSQLTSLGSLTFLFPYKPDWSQVVHLFVAQKWQGTPSESEEMRPEWFGLTSLPLQHMWDDTQYWMPHVLLRQPIEAIFTLNQDNETVKDYSIRLL
jgi:8-oxo-dGTP diphosphatase